MASVRMTKNRWRQLSAQVRQRADDVTETFAGIIEGDASSRAPYQYGHLRGSIAVEGADTGASIARRRIIVGQYYGIFHELGTRYMDARPYLEPAVKAWRADYLRAVGMVVNGGW